MNAIKFTEAVVDSLFAFISYHDLRWLEHWEWYDYENLWEYEPSRGKMAEVVGLADLEAIFEEYWYTPDRAKRKLLSDSYIEGLRDAPPEVTGSPLVMVALEIANQIIEAETFEDFILGLHQAMGSMHNSGELLVDYTEWMDDHEAILEIVDRCRTDSILGVFPGDDLQKAFEGRRGLRVYEPMTLVEIHDTDLRRKSL